MGAFLCTDRRILSADTQSYTRHNEDSRETTDVSVRYSETEDTFSVDAMPAPQEPRPIRWRKGELIGAGAYGRVYMGMNLESGELIAVKQVLVAASTTTKEKAQEHIRELEKEVAVLQNLSHPNIVRYLGTAREEDALNIFLEFVPGGSIASLLQKFGNFTEKVVRMYTRQLMLGLEYLHDHKIMHRDIKGANILVDNKACIKLADFGASKKLADLATISEGYKSMKGTPYWMAPEVIKQTGHGRQADIWSVGCTVIEMATGKPPWSEFQSQVSALFHIAQAETPPEIPAQLSEDARDFLLLCFQRDPKKRPTATNLLKHPFLASPEFDAERQSLQFSRLPQYNPSQPRSHSAFTNDHESEGDAALARDDRGGARAQRVEEVNDRAHIVPEIPAEAKLRRGTPPAVPPRRVLQPRPSVNAPAVTPPPGPFKPRGDSVDTNGRANGRTDWSGHTDSSPFRKGHRGWAPHAAEKPVIRSDMGDAKDSPEFSQFSIRSDINPMEEPLYMENESLSDDEVTGPAPPSIDVVTPNQRFSRDIKWSPSGTSSVASPVSGNTLCVEEDVDTEEKIKSFLEAKALELKRMQTPLFEELQSLRQTLGHGEGLPCISRIPESEVLLTSTGLSGSPQRSRHAHSNRPATSGGPSWLSGSSGMHSKEHSHSGSGSRQSGRSSVAGPSHESRSHASHNEEEWGTRGSEPHTSSPSAADRYDGRERIWQQWKEELQRELASKREETKRHHDVHFGASRGPLSPGVQEHSPRLMTSPRSHSRHSSQPRISTLTPR